MNLRNALGTLSVTVAVGAVALTAMPSAIAGTASAPASASAVNRIIPDWDLGDDECSSVTLSAQNSNRFVSAEVDSTTGPLARMLRNRSGTRGAWEKFTLCPQNGYQYLYSPAAGKYVTVEQKYAGDTSGLLRARTDTPKNWEKLEFKCTQSSLPAWCTIRSVVNGKYVSAELGTSGGNSGMLRARSNSVGVWETFWVDNAFY